VNLIKSLARKWASFHHHHLVFASLKESVATKVGFPLSMLFKTWKLEKEFYKGASFLFPLLFHAYAFPFFMLG
jgi:hypothetical protein